jgi:hypothetical protein
VPRDDLIADGETEPGTSRLRRKQRLEHVPELVARHPDAIVRNLDVNILIRRPDDPEVERAEALRHIGGDAQLARPAVHRIARIQRQVRDHLRDLMGVGGDVDVRGDVDADRHIRTEDGARFSFPCQEERGEIDTLHGRLRGTRIAKDLVSDAFAAADGLEDVIDRLAQIARPAAAHDLEVWLDPHEDVVELVRDRGRDASEAADPFGLCELIIELLPFRQVHRRADHP